MRFWGPYLEIKVTACLSSAACASFFMCISNKAMYVPLKTGPNILKQGLLVARGQRRDLGKAHIYMSDKGVEVEYQFRIEEMAGHFGIRVLGRGKGQLIQCCECGPAPMAWHLVRPSTKAYIAAKDIENQKVPVDKS